MAKRLLALWLLFPPATQVSAWAGICDESGHCGHEFCTCRDHCARKPSAEMPCHDRARAPSHSMNDSCHSEEAAQLLAVSTYLLPDVVEAQLRENAFVFAEPRAQDPLFGFDRVDLPPPRPTAS